jgi:hypothetical protein
MLNIKLAKKWVKALRSGKYRQVQNVLKGPDGSKHVGFCCLGVYCDIYDKTKWKKDSDGNNRYLGSYMDMPEKLRQELGLTSTQVSELVSMNGDYDKSFKDIANHIENYYTKKCV